MTLKKDWKTDNSGPTTGQTKYKVFRSDLKVGSAFMHRQGAPVHKLGLETARQPRALGKARGLRIHNNNTNDNNNNNNKWVGRRIALTSKPT